MRIALAYGYFSTGPNGPFDITKIYHEKGLTGSESFFFNTVKGLAELGHTVRAYCHCAEETDNAPTMGGASFRKVDTLAAVKEWGADVIFSWNEPELFRQCPVEPLRICVQQLNDFNYCHPGYKDFVDLWAIPSEVHRQYLISIDGIPRENSMVVSNCLNEEFYEREVERDPHRIAYCSSPDRGLHHLLEMFPKIRKQVPQATLKVYYKVDPWIAGTKGIWYEGNMQRLGNRARYVQESLLRLGRNGEKGVTLVGPISNVAMAQELKAARTLAYPCDTIRFTEGFSVSIMDACAAGCVPVISDCDAIGSVYKNVAHVIPGLPAENKETWTNTMISVLSGDSKWDEVITRAKLFTKKFTRQLRASQWEKIIRSSKKIQQAGEFTVTTEPNTGIVQYYAVNGYNFTRYRVDKQIVVGGVITGMKDWHTIRDELKVDAVINLAAEFSDQGKGIENLLECGMPDDGSPRPLSWFTKPLDFAWRHLKAGKRLYIHCAAGMSRSPSVAYVIMRGVLGLTAEEALNRIRVTQSDFPIFPSYLEQGEYALTQWKPPAYDLLSTVVVEEYLNTLYLNHPTRRWLLDENILIGGSIRDADDWKHLESDLKVAAVISAESEHSDAEKGIPNLLETPLPDDGSSRPVEWYTKALDFAKPFLDKKQRVHVHCQMGGSRSPAIGYALLRGIVGLSAEEAINRIRRNPTLSKFGEHPYHVSYLASAEAALSVWKK